MKKVVAVIVNIVIILLVLCSYRSSRQLIDIDVEYDESIDKTSLGVIREALNKTSPETVSTFVESGWRIEVVSGDEVSTIEHDLKVIRLYISDDTSDEELRNRIALLMKEYGEKYSSLEGS